MVRPAPERSRERRLRALQQANEIRLARAQFKKEIRSGKLHLAQLLGQPPEHVKTAKVLDLLVLLPRVGPVKARRILGHCRIAHSKTLGGLSSRQRSELINYFND